MVHRINIFLLSIILAIAPAYLYASTSLGGWSLGGLIADGASSIINGTKTVVINGANVVKTSTAKITPTAGAVSKVLARGAAGYALSVAVQELLGAVDWVLDPANNQITYKPTASDPLDPRNQYYYQWYSTKYASLDKLCIAIFKANGWAGQNIPPLPNGYGCRLEGNYVFPHSATGDFGDVGAYRVVNPAYNPNATVEDKKLSLDVIAAQVITNAESSTDQQKKAGAQAATTAAAQDMLANDVTTQNDVETQLNTNAKTQTNEAVTGTSTPSTTNPQVTNISLAFPVFCGWAPLVCEAAQKVITFSLTITDWWNTANNKAESWAQSIKEAWTATKEWMNEEETPEQTTEVEIDQTLPVVPDNQYFNWGAYCPFTPGSQTISLEDTSAPIDYDLTSWCDMAIDIRPFVLAAGALMSFLIASGIIMGRDD